jgi:hypothetical protein
MIFEHYQYPNFSFEKWTLHDNVLLRAKGFYWLCWNHHFKLYDHHHDFNPRNNIPVLSSFLTYHRVWCQMQRKNRLPSGAPEFTPGFIRGSCYSIFSFTCMFCRSLFVLFLLGIVLSVLLCSVLWIIMSVRPLLQWYIKTFRVGLMHTIVPWYTCIWNIL